MSSPNKPPIGASPGTLAIDPDGVEPRITVSRYDAAKVERVEVSRVEDLAGLRSGAGVLWVDVQGLKNESVLREIARVFSVHELVLEDIAHATARPKAELYDEQLLIVTRMLHAGSAVGPEIETITLLLGRDYVVTFQQRYGDVLDPVRRRIQVDGSQIRRAKADYLAYAILDTIIDAYFPIIDGIGDEIEALEDRVLAAASDGTLRELTEIRNRLVRLRRVVVPQRESVNSLIRDENEFIGDRVRMYLRDTYDHIVQEAEAVEIARELTSGLMSTYLSVVGNRTNDVMKMLTIVASIFVPLTFLAGIYGMNFEYMPELAWPWGYPALLAFMAVAALAMVLFFRRKKWL